MKIIYKGTGNLKSKGISFSPDTKEYEVKDADGKYLVKTFPNLFEEVVVKQAAPTPAAPKKAKDVKGTSEKKDD